MQDRGRQLGAGATVVAGIQVREWPEQGGGHDGPRHGGAAGLQAMEHLGQKSPQGQGLGPEATGRVAEGDLFVGKGLLDVRGREDVGKGEPFVLEKRSESILEWRLVALGGRKRHGSLPCQTRKAEPRKASHEDTVGGKGLPTRYPGGAFSRKSSWSARGGEEATRGADGAGARTKNSGV